MTETHTQQREGQRGGGGFRVSSSRVSVYKRRSSSVAADRSRKPSLIVLLGTDDECILSIFAVATRARPRIAPANLHD